MWFIYVLIIFVIVWAWWKLTHWAAKFCGLASGPDESIAYFDNSNATRMSVQRCNHHWQQFRVGGRIDATRCTYCYQVRMQ